MKKLLIIIPTYNEATNIEPLVLEIFERAKRVSGWVFEILVVDDNSPDGTGRVVRQMHKKSLHLITGPRAGYGKAYLRGFAWAIKKNKYNAILMMDADFSHNPAAIPSLLKAIDAGADYVVGSRYTAGGSVAEDWSLLRSYMSQSANWFARLLIGAKGVTDFTGGFKVFRYSAFRQIDLAHIRASGYVFQVNLLHEFSRRGFKIREVPITFRNRQVGVSKMRLRDIMEFVYLTYRLNPNSRVRRMVRFGFVGACGTLVNLATITFLIRVVRWPAILSDAIAIEVSIVANFLLNYFYTFRASIIAPSRGYKDSTRIVLLKLLRFNGVMLGGAGISFVTFIYCYRSLDLSFVIADLLGIIVAMVWNYWLNVRVVWKLVDA